MRPDQLSIAVTVVAVTALLMIMSYDLGRQHAVVKLRSTCGDIERAHLLKPAWYEIETEYRK